jgi:hypothetical protein
LSDGTVSEVTKVESASFNQWMVFLLRTFSKYLGLTPPHVNCVRSRACAKVQVISDLEIVVFPVIQIQGRMLVPVPGQYDDHTSW